MVDSKGIPPDIGTNYIHLQKKVDPDSFFVWETQYRRRYSQTHTLNPMNTRMQPYPYEHLRETEPANPRDWRNHHRCFAVDGNVVYHWKHKHR
jgi:hypothetical protein